MLLCAGSERRVTAVLVVRTALGAALRRERAAYAALAAVLVERTALISPTRPRWNWVKL